ncbi:MAG: twin-arginine translocase subunit TatC [Candidatus Altiarchaeota archaeon]
MASRQTVLEHLDELRTRVLRVVAVIVLTSLLAYPLTDSVLAFMLDGILGGYSRNVVVTTPLEAVLVRFKLSLIISAFISVPIGFYEALRFIGPGLYPRERKWIPLILSSSLLLFTAGVAFAYIVLLPFMVSFLLAFASPFARPMLVLDSMVSFIVLTSAAMGVAFQWPLLVAVLSRLGVVSSAWLSGRRRHAIVACFILGAVFTDPSFITQVLVAVPLVVLYEVGILVARLCEK